MTERGKPSKPLTIRQWREFYGENLQRFATRLDISMTTLQYWERDEKSPRQRMRQRVAERLGIKPDMVIWPEGPEKKLAA